MATLADLKTRIITETNRDDLSDDLAAQLLLHIQRACEFASDERFWFNAVVASVDTTSGSEAVTIPASVRRVDRLTIPALNTEIREVQFGDLEALDAQSGQPSLYAYYNDQLKLWPAPDAAYALQITGLAAIAAPSVDGESSVWTNQAQDLIAARATFTLYRDQFRDTEGAALASGAAKEALARLKRETARRLSTPRRAFSPRRGFNINHG